METNVEKVSEKPVKDINEVLKGFTDLKSMEEFDIQKFEMIRGQTPKDVEAICLQYCKDYLSGNWTQQTVDTITVKRITGGMINQIYHCAINDPDHSQSVPQEVVVKLYGIVNEALAEFVDKTRLNDLIISLIFSEKNIGPKVLALFEQGQILKYYKVRQNHLLKTMFNIKYLFFM